MQGKACLSFTPRGVPGEGLSVIHVVCPQYSERGARGRLVRHIYL